MLEICRFTGILQWKDEYLTPAVYTNLLVNSILSGVSFPVTALLNTCFILCILLRPNLRRKKSTVLIGYLAVTDLVVGVIVQPMFLANVLCQMTGGCNSCAIDTARAYLLRWLPPVLHFPEPLNFTKGLLAHHDGLVPVLARWCYNSF